MINSHHEIAQFLKSSVLFVILVCSVKLQISSFSTNYWAESRSVGYSQRDQCTGSNPYDVIDQLTIISSTLSFSSPLVYRVSDTLHTSDLCFSDTGLSKCAPIFNSALFSGISAEDLNQFYPNTKVIFRYNAWIILLSTVSLLVSFISERQRGTIYSNANKSVVVMRIAYLVSFVVLVLLIASAASFTTIVQENCSAVAVGQSAFKQADIVTFCGGLNDCDAVIKSVLTSDDYLLVHYVDGAYVLSVVLILACAYHFFTGQLLRGQPSNRFTYPVGGEDEDIELSNAENPDQAEASLLDELRAAATLAVQNGTARAGREKMAEGWKMIPHHSLSHLDSFNSHCTICLTALFPMAPGSSDKKLATSRRNSKEDLEKAFGMLRSRHSSDKFHQNDPRCKAVTDLSAIENILTNEKPDGMVYDGTEVDSAGQRLLPDISVRLSSHHHRDLIPDSIRSSKKSSNTSSNSISRNISRNMSRSMSLVDSLIPSFIRRSTSGVTSGKISANNELAGYVTPTKSSGQPDEGYVGSVGVIVSNLPRGNFRNEQSVSAMYAIRTLECSSVYDDGQNSSITSPYFFFNNNSASLTNSPQYTPRRSTPSEVTVVEVPCGHLFHKSCLLEWTTLHETCPICRGSLEIEPDSASY